MEITANAIQSVVQGSNVIFTDTPIPGNAAIIHREGQGLVKLRGLSGSQCRSRFRILFGGNAAIPPGGAPGAITIAITVDGEPVDTTRMVVTPTVANSYFNIFSSIYLDVPTGCCATVGVTNVTNATVNIENANLIVERVA